MKGKMFGMVAILLLGLVAMTGIAAALPTIEYVKINDEKYESGDKVVFELGDTLEIKVKLQAESGDEENIEIEADILGYEYNDHAEISDSTHTFDMEMNDTVYKTLEVSLPDNAEKDEYDLRIRIGGRTGTAFEGLYRLRLEGARHTLTIKDIVLSPENEVMAGRALLATLRIKNYGEKDEESVKVKISIPGLGISASDYIDEIESGESTTSEELYLRIPSCSDEGTYKVVAEVVFDEGYETVKKETSIDIVKGTTCPSTGSEGAKPDEPKTQTIISVGSTSMDVTKGEGGAVYPMTITNAGSSSRTYILTVEGADQWATTKLSPGSAVVLGPGEMKAVYLYLTANEDAAEGEHLFTVSVKSDSAVLKEIPFTANVSGSANGSDWDRLKRGLFTGFAVLLVLIALIGLIIGFNRLKRGNDEEEMDKDKTYY